MLKYFRTGCAAAIVVGLVVSIQAMAQDFRLSTRMPGTIVGTVSMATETLYRTRLLFSGTSMGIRDRTQVTAENGFFSFQTVSPGVPYQLGVSAKNFAEWKSPAITLQPAQYKITSDIELRIEVETTASSRTAPFVGGARGARFHMLELTKAALASFSIS